MGREIVLRSLGWPEAAEEIHHPAGDLGRHGRAAIDRVTQGFHQLYVGSVLEQVSGGAGAQRVEDSLVIGIYRQHHDGHGGIEFAQKHDALNAGHAGQSKVEQDDVEVRGAGSGEGLLHGAPIGDTLKTGGAFDQPAQAFAHAPLIFNDGDVDRAGLVLVGWWQAFILTASAGPGSLPISLGIEDGGGVDLFPPPADESYQQQSGAGERPGSRFGHRLHGGDVSVRRGAGEALFVSNLLPDVTKSFEAGAGCWIVPRGEHRIGCRAREQRGGSDKCL